MEKVQKALFENVNSFFSLNEEGLKEIAEIKNAELHKLARISHEMENIDSKIYPFICEILAELIDIDFLADIWNKEDYKFIMEKEKLKLQINMMSLINTAIDVCLGYGYDPTRLKSNRKEIFTYETFVDKVKKLKVSLEHLKRVNASHGRGKILNIPLDEELDEVFFPNYDSYCNAMGKKVSISDFCNRLIENCDNAIKTKKELFDIHFIDIDVDSIEQYLYIDKLYLFLAFAIMNKESKNNGETLEAWQLEFLMKIYQYAKKYKNELTTIYAPQETRENGKIKMNNMEGFITQFETLLSNKKMREKIKRLTKSEQILQKETIKGKKKIDKISSRMISGIEENFIIKLILNGNQSQKVPIKSFDSFSHNHELLSIIKDNCLYPLFAKIPYLKNINAEELLLDFFLNNEGNLIINIDYISLFTSILNTFGLKGNLRGTISYEDAKTIFDKNLTELWEKVSYLLENKETNEMMNCLYEKYQKEVEEVSYDLFLTRIINALIELLDNISIIKEICDINISYEDFNYRMDKDKYYLNTAYEQFTKLYNQVMKKERVNKEEYLFLARYIEIIKTIIKDGYHVEEEGISCESLLERYNTFILEHALYDLDNATLYNAMAQTESRRTLLSNWKIIPKGQEDSIGLPSILKKKRKQNASYAEKYSKVLERKYFLDHTDYECIILGKDTFKGYIGYKYTNGIIIFEKFFEDMEQSKPMLGNATYVMSQSNFIIHSSKSKTELMSYIKEGHKDVRRETHTTKWRQKITDIINNWGYDPETIKSIDQIVAEANLNNRGIELIWKK